MKNYKELYKTLLQHVFDCPPYLTSCIKDCDTCWEKYIQSKVGVELDASCDIGDYHAYHNCKYHRNPPMDNWEDDYTCTAPRVYRCKCIRDYYKEIL